MSTRENIRLIARAPFRRKENILTFCHFEPTSEVKDVSTDIFFYHIAACVIPYSLIFNTTIF